MKKQQIISSLAEVLGVDRQNLENIGENESLRLLGLNSIRAIEIIVRLEQEFDIEVSDEDLFIDNIDTLEKVKILIDKYIANTL
ncbi:MAG: acyl carrier protein [Lutisporaceae bacterium]